MKERIVVDFEDLKCAEDKNYVIARKEKCKVEKYPETFEELKELCKGITGNKKDCGGAMWFEFGCLNNDKMYLGKFLCVDEKGQVGIAERSWGGDISITIFAQNRTPQQMWQIIKNLIGEE